MHESSQWFIIFGVPFHVLQCLFMLCSSLFVSYNMACVFAWCFSVSKLDVLDLSQLIENAFSVPNRQMVR